MKWPQCSTFSKDSTTPQNSEKDWLMRKCCIFICCGKPGTSVARALSHCLHKSNTNIVFSLFFTADHHLIASNPCSYCCGSLPCSMKVPWGGTDYHCSSWKSKPETNRKQIESPQTLVWLTDWQSRGMLQSNMSKIVICSALFRRVLWALRHSPTQCLSSPEGSAVHFLPAAWSSLPGYRNDIFPQLESFCPLC